MFPYFIAFLISIIATNNAYKCKTKSLLFYIHLCFAISPLLVLAAYRDANIGTDTANYIYLFDDALSNKNDIWNYILLHPSFEIGFLIYNYIIAQKVLTVEAYYLITYGIILGLMFVSAFKLKKHINPTIFIFVYLFLFYSDSLNVMRQYLAVSFVLLAIANLFIGKNNRYIFWTVLAFVFHASALISLGIGLTYWIIKKYPIHRHYFLFLIICIGVLFVGFSIGHITNIGLLPTFEEKLSGHLANTNSSGISNSHIVICLCTLIFLLYNYKNNQRDTASGTMLMITIFTMLFYMSPSMNAILYRLTIYFNVITCFSISYAYKNNKVRVILLLSLYVLFYVYSIVIAKTNEVIPYSSITLGI